MKRLLIGLAVAAVTTIAPQAASAQDSVSLALVHGIPGQTVDVTVGGSVVIDDFIPGSIADISSFAGQTLNDLAVVDGTSGDAIIGPVAEFTVPSSGNWSIVAHLDGAGTPKLTSFENNTSPIASGQARVTLRHTAEAGAVDLVVGDQRPIVGSVNGDSDELELPAGQLTGAQLAPTGDIAIAQIGAIDLGNNTNTIIYVVGSTTNNTIDFVVQVVNLELEVTEATTTTTTQPTPTAINTGSPLDDSNSLLLVVVAIGAVVLAGGALVARRRV